MAQEEIHITTQRIIELIDVLKSKGVIRFRNDFLEAIEMKKQNYAKIAEGKMKFTVDQITSICKTYNANPGWIFGLERKRFRN